MTARTLYVSRQVTNAADVIDWAKANGFGTTLLPDDLHVTVAFSKTAFDWGDLTPSQIEIVAAAGARAVKSFGDGSVSVLAFDSADLSTRWQEFNDAGASWDWPEYQPHVTLTYQPVEGDVASIEPYDGPIHLGPERFKEIDDDWSSKVTEKFTRSLMMPDLQMFIPITKVDAAKRLVYGVATAEIEDRSGEICDYAGTKPLYEKWSGDIAKATDGKSLGNVRAMHGKVAAGKVTSINFNDDDKQIEVCAKVVDDAEWNKVAEGVYTGFSQGGAYVKRWKDEAGLQRYIADPSEISLVDLPCLPTATFQMIKADGMVEDRPFHAPEKPAITNDQVAAKAKELAKAAGDEAKWTDHIEPARAELEKAEPKVEPKVETPVVEEADPRSEVEQVWKSKDGQTFKTKADAVKHSADLAKSASVAKPLDEATAALAAAMNKVTPENSEAIKDLASLEIALKGYEASAGKLLLKRHLVRRAVALKATDVLPDGWHAALEKAVDATLAKEASLYGVAWLANLLDQIAGCENSLEYDTMWSPGFNVPDELKTRFGALIVELGDILAQILDTVLSAMSAEENAEAMTRAALLGDLSKAGARHSKSDKASLQTAHDALVKLGADCGMDKHAEGDLAKADLGKILADNTDMKAAMEKAIEAMGQAGVEIKKRDERIEKLEADMEVIKAQPMPGGPAQLQVVGKEDETAAHLRNIAESGDNNAIARELIKIAQSRPLQGLPGVNEATRDPANPAHIAAPAA